MARFCPLWRHGGQMEAPPLRPRSIVKVQQSADPNGELCNALPIYCEGLGLSRKSWETLEKSIGGLSLIDREITGTLEWGGFGWLGPN